MKLIVIILAFISTGAVAQEMTPKETTRKFLYESYRELNKGWDHSEANFYLKEDYLYIDFEKRTGSDIAIMQSESEFLKEHAKDMIYQYTKRFFPESFPNLLKDRCEVNYIRYCYKFLSSDYKEIKFIYVVDVSDLKPLMTYFNKEDFYKILK